ncbi:hypothetical protein [Streptomyces sp. NPDC005374]|uniref:hypothetical protein n=1 Tax=Streptomyces sp. NPDC005374 TaxID=3364713 RepID=UPI0036BC517F
MAQVQGARDPQKAIVGAVTGPLTGPRTLLLGRYAKDGRLRYTGRTTTPPQAAGRALADLWPRRERAPWKGWTFSAGWGTRETLDVTLVRPELVVEVGADVARDSAGRWWHPVRWYRARPDLSPSGVARFST